MALIKCKECGKEFSDQAKSCIHCGCPNKKKIVINNKFINFILDKRNTNIVISSLFVLVVLIMCLFIGEENRIDVQGEMFISYSGGTTSYMYFIDSKKVRIENLKNSGSDLFGATLELDYKLKGNTLTIKNEDGSKRKFTYNEETECFISDDYKEIEYCED